MKKFLFVMFLCTLFGVQRMSAQEVGYASYSDRDKTLTFYYGYYGSHGGDASYYLNQGYEKPEWLNDHIKNSVKRVVFDSSFKNYVPKTTYCWFEDMVNLESVSFSNLKTTFVENMSNMFYNCINLKTLDLSDIRTDLVKDMSGMFYGCKNLSINSFSWLKPSDVTNMASMFEGCENLTEIDLSRFNTENVTNMEGLFRGCSRLEKLEIGNLNTSKVENMNGMFKGCVALKELNVSSFDTSNSTDMNEMFYGCDALTFLDLSSFNTSKVTGMNAMFRGCSGLSKIYASDSFSTQSVTSSTNMFSGCVNLVGGKGTVYNPSHTDATYAVIDLADDNTPGYFTFFNPMYATYSNGKLSFYCDKLRSTRSGKIYAVPFGYFTPAWYLDGAYKEITVVSFEDTFGNAQPRITYKWFQKMPNLNTVSGMHNFNASEVEDMSYMFADCPKFTYIDFTTAYEHGTFHSPKLKNMRGMFSGCGSLDNLDTRCFDTDEVIYMDSLFYMCSSLTSLDLGDWNTENVTNMAVMFFGCSNLKTIYATDIWSTSNVEVSTNMFRGCDKLVGGKGTKYRVTNVDKTYAHIDGGESNPGYFTDRNYTLKVGSTQVTIYNKSDILEDGLFSYDADNNVLSIKGNYNYDHYEGFIINYLPDLTVYVATDATIECKGAAFITMANLTITGPGRLTLRSETDCGIYARSGSCVTLDGINLDAQGEWAISGQPNGEKLLIRNSTIKAVTTSSSYSAICDFTGGITLEGCKITKPVGGKIQGGNIVAADGSVTQEIVIEKDNPYDLNNDGKVSTADIQVIINEMKKPQASQNMMYDLNADGKISTADIQVIINEMKK